MWSRESLGQRSLWRAVLALRTGAVVQVGAGAVGGRQCAKGK